eukprot:scaffold162_cov275-Pinguiococcus_pyrenoidosus.AAC.11
MPCTPAGLCRSGDTARCSGRGYGLSCRHCSRAAPSASLVGRAVLRQPTVAGATCQGRSFPEDLLLLLALSSSRETGHRSPRENPAPLPLL